MFDDEGAVALIFLGLSGLCAFGFLYPYNSGSGDALWLMACMGGCPIFAVFALVFGVRHLVGQRSNLAGPVFNQQPYGGHPFPTADEAHKALGGHEPIGPAPPEFPD